jgi:hypothetical protein
VVSVSTWRSGILHQSATRGFDSANKPKFYIILDKKSKICQKMGFWTKIEFLSKNRILDKKIFTRAKFF